MPSRHLKAPQGTPASRDAAESRDAPPEGGIIKVEDVRKRFADHTAVDGVSLTVRSGEFFSILGPSGCGKTTLLRMLAGFEQPDAGRIRIDGTDVTGTPPNRRPVHMMFQQYALFPHMTVADNIAFGLRIKRVPRGERARLVDQAMRIVQLDGLERRRPAQLSGGQQQRVALARALVCRPAALLLDEPLGALDVKLRRDMQLELKRVQNEVGTAFVYVTHDQEEALAMSDRIAVMNAGRVEQIGVPRDIYQRPASAFVADFIGELNAMEVDLEPGCVPGTAQAAFDGGQRVVVVDDARRSTRRSARLGVRPERISVFRERPPGAEGSVLKGVARDVVFLGALTRIRVETAVGTLVIHESDAVDGAGVAVGDAVFVGWPAQDTLDLGEAP